MRKIDAHIHYNGNHPECVGMLERLELKLLNVCVAHQGAGKWREQADVFRGLAAGNPRRYAWCTTFDPPGFDEDDYAGRVIEELESDLKLGSVACKVWKNIGMEFKKPSGTFLMVDDPIFDPVYGYLQKEGVTLLAHIGEPLACWRPLDEWSPHQNYYQTHPEWHMHGRAGFPSHQEIIDARDRMLEKFPGLSVVGAHLGSLEYDVAEVVKRLERFPNFSVDSSARMRDLTCQDTAKVRQFFADYQDRILFGTDIVMREDKADLPAAERQQGIDSFERRYRTQLDYYESSDVVAVDDRQVQGLGLPEDILTKFYRTNAERLYPGMRSGELTGATQ